MSRPAWRPGAVLPAAGVVLGLAVLLHWPVVARGALITPAGMHHAQWPWKAKAPATPAEAATLEENHTLSDLLFQVYPWQHHIARAAAQRRLPLWNPYSYSGVPFLANAQSAVLYPLHWPVWLYPGLRVFTVALLLKIVLAGVLMAVFLRGLGHGRAACILGAVSFSLGAFMTSWLGYAHTNAAIFLPLLMHAARGLALGPGPGPFLAMTLGGAAQYLGGHPETSLHIVGVSALYFLWCLPGGSRARLSLAAFVTAGLLGFLAAAAQMLPFLEYLRDSAALAQRQALPTLDPTLPSGGILTLLVPGRYGWPWAFAYPLDLPPFQAVVGYAGASVLLLALVSFRWVRAAPFFHLLAAGSALVVYGPPIVRDGLRWLPVVGLASNNRLILTLGFALAVLAAQSLDRIAVMPPATPLAARLRLVVLIALVAVPLAGLALRDMGRDPRGGRLAAGLVAGTALLSILSVMRPSRRAAYLAGIAAIACVDLSVFAFGFNPHADPARLFPSTPLTGFLTADAASDPVRGGRLMTVGWTMRPETQMVYALRSIEGYDAMEMAPYRRLLDTAGVAAIVASGDIPAAARPLLDGLCLRYVVTPPGGVVSGERLRLAYDGPDGRVFVNETAAPRLGLAGEPPAVAPGGGDAPAPPAIALLEETEGSIAVQTSRLSRPGTLLVRESFAPGWTATVNGARAGIRRAEGVFMAIEVPAGTARVELRYRPSSFFAGVAVSLVSIGLCAGLAWRLRGVAR